MRTAILLTNIFISYFVLNTIMYGRNKVSAINLSLMARSLKCYPDEQEGGSDVQEEEFTDHFWNSSLKRPHIKYYLFTNKNRETPELLHKCGGRLPPETHFDAKNRFIVLFQGFTSGMCLVGAYREWKNQILEKGNYNVMIVDNLDTNMDDYTSGVASVKTVAKQTVFVLQNIETRTGIPRSQLYFVSISLGCAIAAQVGYLFPGVGRITGLDPAMPGYHEDVPPEDRLDSSDANLVDVIHTNMGPCAPFLGIDYDPGHVNFYMGDGVFQPSCFTNSIEALLKGDFIVALGDLLPTLGAHIHSIDYFTQSIKNDDCQFVGVRCKSYEDFLSGKCNSCGSKGQKCALMGFNYDKYLPPGNRSSKCGKKYFVNTKLLCPYCDNSKINLAGFKHTYEASLKH